MVFPFDSSADASIFVDRIDPESSGGRYFSYLELFPGLSIWSLELGATFVMALWLFCLLRRDLSLKNALVAAGGFLLGYAPAIAFNLTHHFANWNAVRERKAAADWHCFSAPRSCLKFF